MEKKNSPDLAHLTQWIGTKIKDARKEQNKTLEVMAESCGISIAMLSKIENGRVFPTLPSLAAIVHALGLNFNTFFENLNSRDYFPGYILVRKNQGKPIVKEDAKGFIYQQVLAHDVKHARVEVSMLTLEKGAKRKLVTTEGWQYLFIHTGEVEYQLNREKLTLQQGDSLLFDGAIPHVPRNNAHKSAVILVIYYINY